MARHEGQQQFTGGWLSELRHDIRARRDFIPRIVPFLLVGALILFTIAAVAYTLTVA